MSLIKLSKKTRAFQVREVYNFLMPSRSQIFLAIKSRYLALSGRFSPLPIRRYFLLFFQKLLLLLPFALSLSLLTGLLLPKSTFEKAKDNILQNPNTPDRIFLTEQLLTTNQLVEAKYELDRVAKTNENAQRLINQVQYRSFEPEKIKNEILLWQRISDQLPTYRDAYLKLAILNYQLYRYFDAKKYLEKALEIDPNNEVAQQLNKVLSP